MYRARARFVLTAVVAAVALLGITVSSVGAIDPAPPVTDGTTVRTSADAGSGGGRELPVLSANGRYAAFVGRGPGKGLWVVDRVAGTTEQLTTNDAMNPSISDDGRFIAYALYGANRTVHLLDRATGDDEVVSVADDESAADGLSDYPSVDANGRFVAFQSTDATLDPRVTAAPAGGGPTKVYVRDMLLGETHMVSVNDENVVAQGNAIKPDITPDGTQVAFASDASNLVPAAPLDEPLAEVPTAQGVYVHDRETGTTTLESVNDAEVAGDDISAGENGPTISADGTLVAFESAATNLVADDTNADIDAFVRDRTAGTTIRVSVDEAGDQIDVPPPGVDETAPAAGSGPVVNGRGTLVAFSSGVDIVAADVNGVVDVYLYDLRDDLLAERVSVAIAGGTDASGTRIDGMTGLEVPQVNGYDAAIGWNGLEVAFVSNGDLAADRPLEEEAGADQVQVEAVSTEPATFTRTRYLNETAPDPGFSDVPTTQPFFDEIAWLADQGLANGYNDGTFRPGATVTRQAMSAFLYRMAGSPAGPFPNPGFSDVRVGSTFYKEIAWMVDEGLANGFNDGTFRPGIGVTRQAASAFLHRFAGAPDEAFPATGFSDVPVGSTFYEEIGWMSANGITYGYANGTFRPGAVMTRQAAAAFLYRTVPALAA